MTPVILVRLLSIIVILAIVPYYPTIVNPSDPIGLAALTPNLVMFAYASDVWLIIDIMTTGGFLWTGLLLVFGIREAHDTSTLWAVLVSIICTAVLILTFWQVH